MSCPLDVNSRNVRVYHVLEDIKELFEKLFWSWDVVRKAFSEKIYKINFCVSFSYL